MLRRCKRWICFNAYLSNRVDKTLHQVAKTLKGIAGQHQPANKPPSFQWSQVVNDDNFFKKKLISCRDLGPFIVTHKKLYGLKKTSTLKSPDMRRVCHNLDHHDLLHVWGRFDASDENLLRVVHERGWYRRLHSPLCASIQIRLAPKAL